MAQSLYLLLDQLVLLELRAVMEPGHRVCDGPKLISIIGSTGSIGTQEARANLQYKLEIIHGEQDIIEVARHPDAATVVTGIVGCAGLKPTVAAIEAGKDITLANKESLIAGGSFCSPSCSQA